MFDWLKRRIVGKQIAGNRRDAMSGKLGSGAKFAWNLIDGWKSFIVGGAAVYKLLNPTGPGTPYIDAVIRALKWETVASAFDPEAMAALVVVVGPFAHKLYKAYKEKRAGVPVELLSKSVVDLPPAVAVAAIQATAADTLKVAVLKLDAAAVVVADAKAVVNIAPPPVKKDEKQK